SHTIAKAVLYGVVTRGIPLFRTPKMRSSHSLLVALAEALLIWVAILLVQSLPYLAALAMALLSSLPKPRAELAGGAERTGG
ncbi:hypothetical protein, partial [Pseudomonas aeruginosa]